MYLKAIVCMRGRPKDVSAELLHAATNREREREREMKITTGAQIERMPSIETEPLTLSLKQLQLAREAALYVLRTNSIEEAISIFTEGLKPVISKRSIGKTDLGFNDESKESSNCPDEHPTIHLLPGLKEIDTAPF